MEKNFAKYMEQDFSNIIVFGLSDIQLQKGDIVLGSRLNNFSLFYKNGGVGFSCDSVEDQYNSNRKTIILPYKQWQKYDLLEFKLPICVKWFTVNDYNDFLKNVTLNQAYKRSELCFINFTGFTKSEDIPRCKSIFTLFS